MRDTSRRSETGNESSNESLLRADISSACPVQSASRAPSRKRAILLSAAALAMTALLLAAFVGNFERSKRTGAKRAGKSFLSMANSYSKQKLSETDESSPTTYCLNGNGYSKPLMGSIEVSRVDGLDDNDYYYLSIQGTTGHHLTAILEGSDGYQKTWNNYGSIWAGEIHKQKVRGVDVVDYLQVQDQMTGETAWFRFPCGDGAIDGIQHADTKEEAPNALCFANNSAGYRKEIMSEISLSKVNGINSDCYYLSVQGPVGHKLTAILEGSDGYHRHWVDYGAIWSSCVHQNDGTGSRPASQDFLQVQDEVTGEVQYFEWPCRGAQDASADGLALEFPPQCAQRETGLGFHKGTCFAEGATEGCALCITGDGLCKPLLGSTTVKKVDGMAGMDEFYFLYIMGDSGHPIKAILTGSDGYTRKWQNYGQLWADNVYKPGKGGRPADAVDHLQVQDSITGEISFFQFPCVDGASAPPRPRAPAPAPRAP
eukprot:CAMPEP_0172187616 /NCGR_PEP_ID=MMETSP1050-20130122/21443_1 /TAXON_ID=233186 /ORGANISM="Cryptomonas curvata, Strain CCAP979/52" /LENGTH=484 /DNA_ID=CAMNT_0012861971 /DNA_START=23 /DNA_END=1474 /DNA_ORIENTATION=+